MVFNSFTKWKLLSLKANCVFSHQRLYNFLIPKIEVVKESVGMC